MRKHEKTRMTRYLALIDGKRGADGAAFPDAPGCVAMGKTVDETVRNAVSALAEWIDRSRSENLGAPKARSIDELLSDPEVAEQREA